MPSPLAGTLASIKATEGSTVEVGALLGVVKEEKPSSTTTKTNKEENGKQKIHALTKTTEKETDVKKLEPLKLIDIVEDEEPLVLDTVASSEINNQTENIKYNKKISIYFLNNFLCLR